ncbi:uncharacterized protein LOC141510163 [Macrotis lagotis]|uniref:uncharacterized protein LOC141510163 n=1 Tax=Macrotis lagotis TaxID=92651 RepID=UPI003D696931
MARAAGAAGPRDLGPACPGRKAEPEGRPAPRPLRGPLPSPARRHVSPPRPRGLVQPPEPPWPRRGRERTSCPGTAARPFAGALRLSWRLRMPCPSETERRQSRGRAVRHKWCQSGPCHPAALQRVFTPGGALPPQPRCISQRAEPGTARGAQGAFQEWADALPAPITIRDGREPPVPSDDGSGGMRKQSGPGAPGRRLSMPSLVTPKVGR